MVATSIDDSPARLTVEPARIAGAPKVIDYYLGLWGTRDEHRVRGHGMALLTENLARIDAERMPAHLESSNLVNNHRYESE